MQYLNVRTSNVWEAVSSEIRLLSIILWCYYQCFYNSAVNKCIYIVFCQNIKDFQAYKQLFTFTYKMYGLGFNAIVVFVLFGVCPNLKDEQACLKPKTSESIKDN